MSKPRQKLKIHPLIWNAIILAIGTIIGAIITCFLNRPQLQSQIPTTPETVEHQITSTLSTYFNEPLAKFNSEEIIEDLKQHYKQTTGSNIDTTIVKNLQESLTKINSSPQEAKAVLEIVAKNSPTTTILILLAYIYYKEGNYSDAKQTFNKALSASMFPSPDHTSLDINGVWEVQFNDNSPIISQELVLHQNGTVITGESISSKVAVEGIIFGDTCEIVLRPTKGNSELVSEVEGFFVFSENERKVNGKWRLAKEWTGNWLGQRIQPPVKPNDIIGQWKAEITENEENNEFLIKKGSTKGDFVGAFIKVNKVTAKNGFFVTEEFIRARQTEIPGFYYGETKWRDVRRAERWFKATMRLVHPDTLLIESQNIRNPDAPTKWRGIRIR